jgi:hypothetical protein
MTRTDTPATFPSKRRWRLRLLVAAIFCSSTISDGIGIASSGAATPLQLVDSARANVGEQPVGSAIVDVTVLDAASAPLRNVTVKLSGVVDREMLSDDAGYATFVAIPAGRYDIVASQKGLAPSTPRVLDVAPFGLTSITVTLKPFGPGVRVMQACGGFNPSSLATMAEGAHLLLHVKVLEQTTVEIPLSGIDGTTYLATLNTVEVRGSFRRSLRGPTIGLRLTIRQGGGRLDRGDYIDSFQFNNLAPLNVGDEYFLFVYADDVGTFTIHGAEEGAFRLRNGRVDPLGRGGAATDWAQRSVADFLEALRRLR